MAAPEYQRPGDDDVVSVVQALDIQAQDVSARGARVAAQILAAVREDVVHGGNLASALPASARFGDLVGLRVMAAVHRLALDRRAPEVAVHLPTLGGTPPATDSDRRRLAAAVVAALEDNADVLAASLARTPQTNETGRAALLRCALARLDPAVPVRLREVGASAGLNLRADRLPGLPGLEQGPLPPVADRLGCDLAPIDPLSAEGRLALSSYIWVDDVDRFARLGSALAVAREVPATVVRADAAEFVEGLAAVPGHATVLWHSAFRVYLPGEAAARLDAAVQALGAGAAADAPVMLATWEWVPDATSPADAFVLTVTTWGLGEDGVPRVVARGNSHGDAAVLVA